MAETRSCYCKNRRRREASSTASTAEWTAKIRRDISTRLLSETINESPPPADQRKSIRVSDSIHGLPLSDAGCNVKGVCGRYNEINTRRSDETIGRVSDRGSFLRLANKNIAIPEIPRFLNSYWSTRVRLIWSTRCDAWNWFAKCTCADETWNWTGLKYSVHFYE